MRKERISSRELKQAPEQADSPAGAHDRGLAADRDVQAGEGDLLLLYRGRVPIHLLHKDLGDEVTRLALKLRFDPESRLVALLLEKVDLIDAHRLKQISVATFGYSALALTEGIGLLLEKVWAEYLTLILTMSFLPWELYELVRQTGLVPLEPAGDQPGGAGISGVAVRRKICWEGARHPPDIAIVGCDWHLPQFCGRL